MLRYNSTVPQVEAYYSGGWNALGGGASTITLGTSASVTNPQRSGDATTGFYSAAVNTIGVAAGGIEAEQWNTLASGVDYPSVTPGKSGTAPEIAIAGTTANQDLAIMPAGTGGVGIGTTSPTSLLHTADATAQTTSYIGVEHNVAATSSTASVNKTGMDIQSTGTWNGTSAVNTGLNVNATGGTTNYAAMFQGGMSELGPRRQYII